MQSTGKQKKSEGSIDIDVIEPCVCIIGVGFVGEALLREFGQHFKCIGFDISQSRIEGLSESFKNLPRVILTTDETHLREATHFLISVPTPLKKDRSINLSYLLSAVHTTLNYARPGSAIILESTVCVGTTRQCLNAYKDTYHCGMSPERIDPGRITPSPNEIPKLVSGLTLKALAVIQSLYARVFDQVIPVSSPETAEMTKLFENSQRMINIAYVNEMADAARTHGIDPDEMIRAASSKPYGFTPYSPGLGVGGTCIPVNPYYLFANNKNLPVLEKATAQMRKRPSTKARKLHARLSTTLDGRSPRILVIGLGYKPGQSLLSASPGMTFAERLRTLGCSRLAFYDPLVQDESVEWMEKLEDKYWCTSYIEGNFDAVVVCMKQVRVDFGVLDELRKSKVVVQEFR